MSTPSDKTLRLERTKLTPGAPKGRNTTLMMAMVAGLAAAALAYVFINNSSHPAAPPPPTPAPVAPPQVSVLVATSAIPQSAFIDSSKYKIVQTDPAKVPQDSISNPADVANKVALVPIAADAPILRAQIAPHAFNTIGMSDLIKNGYRAVTISLDPQSSVAGFVKPGDSVDVLGTFDLGQNHTVTKAVLQNVYLLATGENVIQTPPALGGNPNGNNNSLLGNNNNNANQPDTEQFNPHSTVIPNATVMLLPVDAEKIVVAQAKGRLMLALRNKVDSVRTNVPAVDVTAVAGKMYGAGGGGAPPPPPAPVMPMPPMQPMGGMSIGRAAPPPPPSDTVIIIKGATTSLQNVPI